jgi:dihydroorotate dehydrogenase
LDFKGEFVGLGGVFDEKDAQKYQSLGASMVGFATKLMIE